MIHTIFADAGPSAAGLGSQVLVFAFWASVAGNLALVATLFIRPRISPQPLEVKAATEFARESDCVARHNDATRRLDEMSQQRENDAEVSAKSRKSVYMELDKVRKEMGEMERRLNQADEDRTSALHERLNDILLAVGELRGKAK